MIERVCEACGASFEAFRRDARFCSDRCRKRAARTKSAATADSAPPPVERPVLGDLARIRRYVDRFGGSTYRNWRL